LQVKGKVLGQDINVSNIQSISSSVFQVLEENRCGYVCVSNVHMVFTAKNHASLRAAMSASLANVSDGMPLVWELRRQGYKRTAQRVSGPDLMIELCKKAQADKLPIYFYGGSPLVVELMKEKLLESFPNLLIAGLESPPMLPDEPEVDQVVVDRIKDSGAKIVFVGLGCPKQELWMHAYSPHIPAVLIGVGAAFDFFAGSVKRAPLWMQKSGLEWFYRLCSEPRRLWKRYLVTNSLFIWYVILERLGIRK